MKYAQKAADDLKLFIKKFQPLLDVAKVLEDVGSLDNAVEEVKKAKADADKVCAEAVEKKEKALANLEKAEQQVQASYNLAKEHEQKAFVKAQQILEDAQAAAKGVEKVAFEKLQKVEEQRIGFAYDSAQLQKEIDAKKVELSELQAKIEEIKLRLANFIK
jgi:hypothetical protein